jgi:hypothetical protein
MRKTIRVLLVVALFAVVVACTTSKYVTSGVDIRESYQYGYIKQLVDYGGSAQLGSMDIEVFQLIEEAGIKMIGEGEIANLTDQQKQQLLEVKYGVSASSDESVVTITFFDYITKRPLVNCTGASAWGLPNIDVPAAKKKALEQLNLALRG